MNKLRIILNDLHSNVIKLDEAENLITDLFNIKNNDGCHNNELYYDCKYWHEQDRGCLGCKNSFKKE